MHSKRQGQVATEINGINVKNLINHGAIVYPFEQKHEIQKTNYKDGLCFGFTASLMRNLNAGYFSNVRFYSNFNQPLPKFLLTEAVHLTYQGIQQVREGGTIESVAFNGRDPIVNLIHSDAIATHLSNNTRGALLTYKTKNNSLHQLLFFNKGNGKCVIQDPNRFTIDNIDIADGKQVLTDIIRRSNPNHVFVAKETAEIRYSKL